MGGGPAGAVTAIGLARLGRDVVLCEAKAFPRDHIGICLSAGVHKQLAFLNLGHVLHRPDHRHVLTVARRWTSEQFQSLTNQGSTIVNRGLFDSDLIEAARVAGVRILQPARVSKITRLDGDWQLSVQTLHGDQEMRANFVIEAGGRQSRVRQRVRSGPSTLALCGRWRGRPIPGIRISAEPNGWIWAATLPSDSTVAIAFVEPKAWRRAPGMLEARYRNLVEAASVLDGDAQLTGPLELCDATPYVAAGEIEGLLRVGDADVVLDPLSSSGVQAAIQSALAATPIVNTLLTASLESAAALEFWHARRQGRIAQNRRWTGESYADAFARHPTDFWRRRAKTPSEAISQSSISLLPQPEQMIELNGAVHLAFEPCLTDRFIERIECLTHAGLFEPVAFVDGVYLPPLLRRIGAPRLARDVLADTIRQMN